MIEYKATDLPGKIAYEKPFNVKIRCITPVEQKYILSLSQKEQKTAKEYMEFLKKLIQIDNPSQFTSFNSNRLYTLSSSFI